MGPLHENQYAFMIIYSSVLFRMKTLQKNIVEKIKTRILCLITFFENLAFYKKMWKNFVEPSMPWIKI